MPDQSRYILYVDMDGVLCDLAEGYRHARTTHPEVAFPQSIPGLFENLQPVRGAIEAVNTLRNHFEIYVLTAPSTRNPRSYMEKRVWVEKHFDYALAKRLILCPDKGLMKGDYLIDDHLEGKGQDRFDGEVLHFASTKFPDWTAILHYLLGPKTTRSP